MIVIIIIIYNRLSFYNANSSWPYLAPSWNVKSTEAVVSLILGHRISSSEVCKSVPLHVEANATSWLTPAT